MPNNRTHWWSTVVEPYLIALTIDEQGQARAAAVTGSTPPPDGGGRGQDYYRRKIAEGKTLAEARAADDFR